MSQCVKQTNLRKPPSEKKHGMLQKPLPVHISDALPIIGVPSSDVPPSPSRSARYASTRGGSSSVTGKLSTNFEATADDGINELEPLGAIGVPIIVTDSGSSVQYTNPTVSKTPASVVSSQPKQPSSATPATRRLNNGQRAALIAHEQSLNKPSVEVFYNLFTAMSNSLATDIQKQHDKYHFLINSYHRENEAKLKEEEQQNIRLQERLVTLEKARGEDRGYWEAEKKNLLQRLENGEDGRDREERLRREEEERVKEKEEVEKTMRRLIESFEAKKKIWAKEKEATETKKRELSAELEVKNQRLEDTITNNAMLLERLGALEKEKNELMGRFDEEKKKWKDARFSLQEELSFAKHTVERLENECSTAHWGAQKALTDVQRENEILNETIRELTRRIEWQEEIGHKEKSRMETRLKEEINDVTVLRHQLYQKETKRKREDGHQEMFLQIAKKPRIETLVDPEQESDEDEDDKDDDEISSIEAPYDRQMSDDIEGPDDGFDDIVEDQGEESSEEESDEEESDEEESDRSHEGSEDELR